MIHQARQSAKFTKLIRRLRSALPNLPIDVETVATGILERLWHFTIVSARRGDVGRHDDDVIAEAVGWFGEPSELVEMLVETGWIDEDSEHRLLVHDWHEHAPAFIKRNIGRDGGFLTCAGKPALNDSVEHASGYLTTPECLQERTPNQTKPNLTISIDRLERPIDEEVLKKDCQKAVEHIDPQSERRRPLSDRDRDFCIRAIMAKWLVCGLNPHQIYERMQVMRREGNPPDNPWAYFRAAIQKRLAKLGYDPHTLDELPIPESLQRRETTGVPP